MDIGIGLPNTLLGARGPDLVEWARRADEHGFSVLGTIGRIVYDNHEELIALAAAAGATERIDLMPSVLVGPPRQAVLLAKQAATLSLVSGGRFRLGLGIGARDDDWLTLGAEPSSRGAKLDELVEVCRSVWAGEVPAGAESPVGPRPDHLPVVLGGYSEPAFRRAGRLADAFLAGPMPPEGVGQAYEAVKAGAAEAGREAPALYAARYTALGDEVQEEADRNAGSYYGFAGEGMVDMTRQSILRTPQQVTETIDALAEQGVEELCLWPMAAGLDQVERFAEAALG